MTTQASPSNHSVTPLHTAHKQDVQPLFHDQYEQHGFETDLEQFLDDHYGDGLNRPLDEMLDHFLLHHSTGNQRVKLESAIERLKQNTDMLHALIRSKSLRNKLTSSQTSKTTGQTSSPKKPDTKEDNEPYPSADLLKVYFLPFHPISNKSGERKNASIQNLQPVAQKARA